METFIIKSVHIEKLVTAAGMWGTQNYAQQSRKHNIEYELNNSI